MSPTQRGLLLAAALACCVGLLILLITSAAAAPTNAAAAGGGASYVPHPMNHSKSSLCAWQQLYLPQEIVPSGYVLNVSTAMAAPDWLVGVGVLGARMRARGGGAYVGDPRRRG
jgi:hypothetical protein